MQTFTLTSPANDPAPTQAPGLSPEQKRQLERIKNRPTMYEAVIIRADGEKRLLAYCVRKNKVGLRTAITGVRLIGLAIFVSIATSQLYMAAERGSDVLHITNRAGKRLGHRIEFSGRTKRDVIMDATPLPFIGEGIE